MFLIFPPKCMYNTNKLTYLLWNLPIKKGPEAVLLLVLFFCNHLVHETMNGFLHMNNFLYIWTPFPLYWDSKKSQLVLSFTWFYKEIIYFFRLQGFFKSFNDWSIRFDRNIFIIILFTCKVCIIFLLFVVVSTCSVWLLLHVFLRNTFNQNLQNITTWNIRPPIIFQVYIKVNKSRSLPFRPRHIISHHLTISPYHHLAIFRSVVPTNHSTIPQLNKYHPSLKSSW